MVLSREEAGAQKIFLMEGIQKLNRLLDSSEQTLRLGAVRVLTQLAKASKSRVSDAQV